MLIGNASNHYRNARIDFRRDLLARSVIFVLLFHKAVITSAARLFLELIAVDLPGFNKAP